VTFLNSYTYSLHVLPLCSIVLSCSIFLSSSDVSPKLFLIFVNNCSADSTSDSPFANSSNRLSFHASATPPYTYDNTQATWVVAASTVIFILIYRRVALINVLTSFIFPLKTWGLATSTLLPCYWRSMVLTCCCRVAIMARSCSSLVGDGCWRGAGAGDVSSYCCC